MQSWTSDSKDADGNLKSEWATPENYPMTPQPSEWIPQLEENLKATTNPDKVAAVAGATLGSNHAKALYKAVIEKAQAATPPWRSWTWANKAKGGRIRLPVAADCRLHRRVHLPVAARPVREQRAHFVSAAHL